MARGRRPAKFACRPPALGGRFDNVRRVYAHNARASRDAARRAAGKDAHAYLGRTTAEWIVSAEEQERLAAMSDAGLEEHFNATQLEVQQRLAELRGGGR